MTTRRTRPAGTDVTRTPIVIGADVIMDLVGIGRRRALGAEELFDGIAADVESGDPEVPAWISPITVPLIYYLIGGAGGPGAAEGIVTNLLRLVRVAPLTNADYVEATHLRDFEFEDAIQFVTCQRVGARYFVTAKAFDAKRLPVQRRAPLAVSTLFRHKPVDETPVDPARLQDLR